MDVAAGLHTYTKTYSIGGSCRLLFILLLKILLQIFMVSSWQNFVAGSAAVGETSPAPSISASQGMHLTWPNIIAQH